MLRNYLRVRVRQYLRETGAAVRRHWQWLALIVGFFFLVIDFKALAAPLPSIQRSPDVPAAGVLALMIVHLLGVVWIVIQRPAIDGGAPATFMRTLPVPARLDWRATLYVLLLSNGLFWLYLALPLVLYLPHARDVAHAIELFCLVVNAALMLLLVQVYWLHGVLWVLPAVLASDFAVTQIHSRLDVAAAVALSALAATLLLLLLSRPLTAIRRPAPRALRGLRMLDAWGFGGGIVGVPRSLLVQHRILVERNLPQTLMRWCAAGFVALGAWAIIAFGGRAELGGDLLVISGCLIALLLSGLFRVLAKAHAPVQPYLRSLPARPLWLWFRDVFYVALLGASIMLPLSIVFLGNGSIDLAHTAVAWIAWVGLLGLLQPASTLTGQHTVALTSLLTLGWTLSALSF